MLTPRVAGTIPASVNVLPRSAEAHFATEPLLPKNEQGHSDWKLSLLVLFLLFCQRGQSSRVLFLLFGRRGESFHALLLLFGQRGQSSRVSF